MSKWSNAKHEAALFKRRAKNDERKYTYETEISTGYEISLGSSTATKFNNPMYTRKKKNENKS